MQFVKNLRKLYNSNYVISLTQTERSASGLKVGDLAIVEIKLLKEAYKCNHCDGICYLNVETQQHIEDTEIICDKCGASQKLADVESYEDYLNSIKK